MPLKYRDQIDRKLVALLEENARLSATELAKRLGLARSTVHERMTRLERDGVIMGYAAIVPPARDDEINRALIFVRTRQRHGLAVVASLKTFPEVRSCHSVCGPSDLVCQVEAPCLEDLDALIDEIAQLSNVEHIESTIIMATKFDRMANQRDRPQRHLAPVAAIGAAR